MATVVKTDRILKDLQKLWVDLGKQDESGVLRACAMTLIVAVEDTHDTAQIGETIASLMHEHPSRAIVIRVRAGDEPYLEGRVFAQCWMPFGRRQQICCEQIEITASIGSLADVPPVVRGLIVPDLPVVLYCPSNNVWRLRDFGALLALASKLIIDSAGLPDCARVLKHLNELTSIRRADLAWSRLTPWRESVAQVFEHPARRRRLFDLTEVRIMYKSQDPENLGEPSSVYYLAGWFMHVLGTGVKLKIAPGAGPAFASIVQVELIGPDLNVSIALTGELSSEVHINGERQQVAVFPIMGECEALRQELAIVGRDRVFEDVTGLAQLLKGAQQ